MKLTDYSEDIKYLKKEIKKYSQSEELTDWIKEKLNEMNPQWKLISSDEAEFYRLSRIERMFFRIRKDKASNVKAYVERELKRQQYLHEDEMLENDIENMKAFDENEGKRIREKFDALVKMIKKEDPEFWEDRKRRFNHTMFLLGNKLSGQHGRVEE